MSHEQAIKTALQETQWQLTQLEKVFAEASKGARTALRVAGVWQQEFHGQELIAIIAVYVATKSVLDKKCVGLELAIDFIGKFEESTQFGDEARQVLEAINHALVGETIQQSIDAKTKARGHA